MRPALLPVPPGSADMDATRRSILLVHPPVSKPCEPPPGAARLAYALRQHHIPCRVWDANLEGLLYLLKQPVIGDDTWTRRAAAHVSDHLAAVRSNALYASPDRYRRAVNDINRVLHAAGVKENARISLSDYQSGALSPVKSADLLASADLHFKNPFFPFFKDRLPSLVELDSPDVIGFSLNFMSQALCAFAMAGYVRKIYPEIRIVMGGGLVTSWMNTPGFANPFSGLVDQLVCGPGEDALISLCAKKRVPETGVGYDFSDTAAMDYLSPGPILPYAVSRGCYWKKCAFCPERSENSGYEPDDMDAALADIRRLVSQMQPVLIHFTDNALSPRTLRRLIAHPPGRPWYGFVRITRHLADPDFVNGLKLSGCVMLKLGVESGDQGVLDALDKGMDLAVASAALKNLHRAGIATYVYLLFGTPAENEAAAGKTLDFALAHAHAIDFLNLAIFNLPANSDSAETLATHPFYPGDLSLYREFDHPSGWNRDRVRKFLSEKFKRPLPIRNIVQRDPPFFTSNHAPFFVMPAHRG